VIATDADGAANATCGHWREKVSEEGEAQRRFET
jgi:hypothetical protein